MADIFNFYSEKPDGLKKYYFLNKKSREHLKQNKLDFFYFIFFQSHLCVWTLELNLLLFSFRCSCNFFITSWVKGSNPIFVDSESGAVHPIWSLSVHDVVKFEINYIKSLVNLWPQTIYIFPKVCSWKVFTGLIVKSFCVQKSLVAISGFLLYRCVNCKVRGDTTLV